MTKSDPELIVDLISSALGDKNRNKKIFLNEPDFNGSNANLYVNSCF